MTNSNKKLWHNKLEAMLRDVKTTAPILAQLSAAKKKKILLEYAKALLRDEKKILKENQKDLRQAKADRLNPAMTDRLTLNSQRIRTMADGVRVVANLKDNIGHTSSTWRRPNGLKISKVIVPIGVILIIYESRPNVTVECASLCFKSGNVVILRGGREAFYSNRILVKIFENVLLKNALPKSAVNFVETTDRDAVDFLLKRESDIHLVIPRGGEALIRKVAETARMPVIKHYQGICHVYVDQKADLKKAMAIAFNAKMQRPGVCNAMETLLVNRNIASRFLPLIGKQLSRAGCEIRGDQATRRYIPGAKPAQVSDYGHEFLDKILAVKVVSNVKEAIEHIRQFGSAHTDAIVTEDKRSAEQFKKSVDSSSVMVNASTRFADGFEYGFGAEIGISTDKIHARGPMGLEGLTTYKFIVEGNGQVRL